MGLYSGTINITTVFIICIVVVFIGIMDAFVIEVMTIGPVVERVLIDGRSGRLALEAAQFVSIPTC